MNLFAKSPRDGEVILGSERVKIPKLTPAKWRELFSVIDKLPSLIFQVIAAPPEDRKSYIMVAADEALEEICDVVAILSGMEADYIRDECGLDEIVEYLTKTAKQNRLGEAAKNARSLLGKTE